MNRITQYIGTGGQNLNANGEPSAVLPTTTMGAAAVLRLLCIDRNGQPVEPIGASPDLIWRFVMASDFDGATVPQFVSPSVVHVGAGEWEVSLATTHTAEMVRFLHGLPGREIGWELQGRDPENPGADPVCILQSKIWIRNRMDGEGSPHPVFPPIIDFSLYTIRNAPWMDAAALRRALDSVPGDVPGSHDEIVAKLEALVGALKTIA